MKWFKQPNIDPLAVSMAGLKLGDRLLVMGCSDPILIARLATKVGLTGRTCAADEDETRATEAGRIAEREGALIETAHTPDWSVPYTEASFDVVVLRQLLGGAASGARDAAPREALRVLRAGGRCVGIDGGRKRGLGALVGGGQLETPDAGRITGALSTSGFVAVRTLAEREGMVFVEGVKRNA